MLSESRITEIKKRKDAATPGPWRCLSAEFTKLGVNFEMVMPEKVIAFPDAEFLAHSITDISDLLAEREELVRALESKSEGAKLIAAERERQVAVEGWTPEHDDKHAFGELGMAAACYASPVPLRAEIEVPCGCREAMCAHSTFGKPAWVDAWPWAQKFDKRKKHERLKQLAIAGALIAAEIDRLKRLPVAPEGK